MRTTWETKWGPRRVRQELPTLEEAMEAAAGMTADTKSQIEMAAQLLNVHVDEIQRRANVIISARATRPRVIPADRSHGQVTVERKRPRRILQNAR